MPARETLVPGMSWGLRWPDVCFWFPADESRIHAVSTYTGDYILFNILMPISKQ